MCALFSWRRSYSASLTVEASFVFPLVVLFLMSLIALCIRLHNDIKWQADTISLTEYKRNLNNSGVEELQADCRTSEYSKEKLERGYICADAPQLEVSDEGIAGLRRETIRRLIAVISGG